MHDFKPTDQTKTETKGTSNKKPGSSGEKHRKGRRKTSTGNNSPTESPSRVGGSVRPSKRNTGKQREQNTGSGSESGSGLELPQQTDQFVVPKQSKQKKSKGSATGGGEPPPSNEPSNKKETDISVRAVYPCAGLGSSTGR